MSRLTTTPLVIAPPASEGINVTTGALSWVNGPWVEFLAATSAADTAIAGICLQDLTLNTWSGLQLEAEIGIGPEDAEVAIGHIRISAPSSGNGGPTVFLIPYPISGITIGTRVSVRFRQADNTEKTWACTLLYYNDLDSDQGVPYTTATLTSFPSGANSIELVPGEDPWENGAWAEYSAAVGEETFIIGAALGVSGIDLDREIDLGTGELGVETALTTFRFGSYGGGRFNQLDLMGMMPILITSRLVARLRQTEDGDPLPVAFLAYTGPLVPPELGTLIITKETDPPASLQEFDFTTTGGLTPDTFTLTDGQSQTYNDLPAGTYGVEETVPAGWSVGYVVSNGDPIDAIEIGEGETVTVTVTNTQDTPPPNNRSGIYELVPGKTDDTLWTENFEGEEDVKIPDPFFVTGLIGE